MLKRPPLGGWHVEKFPFLLPFAPFFAPLAQSPIEGEEESVGTGLQTCPRAGVMDRPEGLSLHISVVGSLPQSGRVKNLTTHNQVPIIKKNRFPALHPSLLFAQISPAVGCTNTCCCSYLCDHVAAEYMLSTLEKHNSSRQARFQHQPGNELSVNKYPFCS